MPASSSTTRRRFVLTAGAIGTGAVAMPHVSRAQTITWKYQSTWPTKDIFHEFAVDFAKKVNEMSGGRLKLDVLPSGAVVPPFQTQDAVHAGILDAGHGAAGYWFGKHKAFALFGTPPSLGWDAHSLLAWFYAGGGEALYQELLTVVLKLNLTGFLYYPMPTEPLGWFKREVKSADAFKGMKFRSVGLAAELFKELGAAVTILPGGDIVPAMDRGLLDAAEFSNPSSDLLLGFPDVSKLYMMGSYHQSVQTLEIIFNRTKFNALAPDLKAIIRNAALAASSDNLFTAYDRYSRDLDEIKKRNVSVIRTGEAVLQAQLAAWDKVLAEPSQEPFFKKVLDSQKSWVRRTQPYLQVNNLSTAELLAAYTHFFG